MYPFAPPLVNIDAESIEAIQSIYGWLPNARCRIGALPTGPGWV
jgi:hypothetical protein